MHPRLPDLVAEMKRLGFKRRMLITKEASDAGPHRSPQWRWPHGHADQRGRGQSE